MVEIILLWEVYKKMIRSITRSELPACLEIFHCGYETVAVEFGLTEDNCPDRGRASLPFDKLVYDFDSGVLMFGYFVETQMVGFMGMRKVSNGVCKLNDIIVLPEYRRCGYGQALLDFCKKTARDLGATTLSLGMIDDNIRLKNWYLANGFICTELKKFDKAPFTVGYMKCIL